MSNKSLFQLFLFLCISTLACVSLEAQCFQFASGASISLSVQLTKVAAPTISTPLPGITSYTYKANSIATITVNGITHVGSNGGGETIFVIETGATGTYFTAQVNDTYGASSIIGASVTLQADENSLFPNGLLPDGLPAALPPLPEWTATQNNVISGGYTDVPSDTQGAVGPLPITAIGSCSAPPPATCTINSLTLAHVPGTSDSNRAVTGRIGVGENIYLSLPNSQSATWTLTKGKGSLVQDDLNIAGSLLKECSPTELPTSPSGNHACFIAPFTNDVTTVKASLSDGSGASCSVDLTTVQPTGLIFQRLVAPPLPKPGYGFHTFFDRDLLYGMQMYSAVFLTPGDVSFANIRIAELDIPRPFSSSVTSIDTPIVENNAWFLACDFDGNTSVFRPSKTPTTWEYTYGSADFELAHKVPFSKTLTTLAHSAGSNFVFKKGQVEALSSSGAWISTPDALESVLDLPFDTRDADLPSLGPTKRPPPRPVHPQLPISSAVYRTKVRKCRAYNGFICPFRSILLSR